MRRDHASIGSDTADNFEIIPGAIITAATSGGDVVVLGGSRNLLEDFARGREWSQPIVSMLGVCTSRELWDSLSRTINFISS